MIKSSLTMRCDCDKSKMELYDSETDRTNRFAFTDYWICNNCKYYYEFSLEFNDELDIYTIRFLKVGKEELSRS